MPMSKLHFLRRLKAIKRKIPIISNIHLNFICLHYAYIIGVSILGSIILYPGGNMSYTDALFFASGTATQSGLNPIDVKLLYTYQQVWLWVGSMVANPIVIHSFLVFVRLYWFERRFQHVVREAKALRRSRSRSRARTVTRGIDDQDLHRAETGVRGRKIVVLRNNEGQAQGHSLDTPKRELGSPSERSTFVGEGDGQGQRSHEVNGEVWANVGQPKSTFPGESTIRWAPQLGHERHIEFLQNQRRETGALRIPSPREFDRGGMPQSVEDTDGGELERRTTSQSEQQPTHPGTAQHITIDEPDIGRSRRTTAFPRIGSRHAVSDREREASETASTQQPRQRRGTLSSILPPWIRDEIEEAPYLSWQPTLGRNSAFVELTESQREELGGIEYRALKTLAIILIGYFVCFHLLGIVCLIPWILENPRYGNIVREAGQGRSWWAVFTSGSSFNDQGFALTPNSMIPFYDAIFPLLLLTFLIIIGNTAFPCMLRFIIWFMSVLVPKGSGIWEELRFLLDHPRRCFSLLFPGSATWWLFWIVVLLNGIDLIFFIVLDLNNPYITRIPGGIRVVNGLFEAAATRTAGLSVVEITKIHPAVQVSYMIMMYISVYPIAISMRRTNVYEERSLGVYSNPDEDETGDEKEPSYVGAHLRKQLSFDIWYIFLGLFFIAIIEGGRLDKEQDFSLFAILFEVVSAYGTVGLSLGFPGTNTSFSGQFKILSKLIIIAMEVRGRHRGLPYSLDRAVLLPSETLHKKEVDDASKRFRRRGSTLSGVSPVTWQTRDGSVGEETGMSTGRQGDALRPVTSSSSASPRSAVENVSPGLSTHHEQ